MITIPVDWLLVFVLVSIGLALLVRLWVWWWGGVASMWQPQEVVVTHESDQTPMDILFACCGRILLALLIAIAVGVGLFLFLQDWVG